MTRIEVGLHETNMLTRFPCSVCGGTTDKEMVLAEFVDDDGDRHQVCGGCLQAPDEIASRLIAQAEAREAWAAWIRGLASQTWVLPTYDQYVKANRDVELRVFGPEPPELRLVAS